MSRWVRYYLNLKFNQKLLLSFFIILLPAILLISGVNYAVSTILITRYATNYSKAISSQIAANFSSLIDSIEETNFIKYQNDRAFTEPLTAPPPTPIHKRLLYQTAIDDLLYSTPYYKAICFIDKNDNIYSSNDLSPPSYRQQTDSYGEQYPTANELPEEIADMKNNWGKCIWSSAENGNLLLKRALYHINTGSYIGSMIIEIDSCYLSKVYEQSISNYGGSVVVFDKNDNLMISEGKQLSGFVANAMLLSPKRGNPIIKAHGQTYITAISQTSDERWTLVHIITLSELTGDLNIVGYWIILVSIVIFSFAIIIAYLISGNIAQNLKLLLSSMDELSIGNFEKEIVPASQDEFGIIADKFNNMTRKIKKLMDEAAHEQKQKAEYQMLEFQYNALQARLNPHFLYNVLDSISSLAKLRDEYELSEWICLLSDLLRESIGQKKRLIPLKDELSYVKKYTTLYEMMYQDRVNIIYQNDENSNHICVPTFILQPIVENAIVHGIDGHTGDNLIKISSFARNGKLILQVFDNGIGMSHQQLHQVLASKPKHSEDSSTEFSEEKHTKAGLMTVSERIKLLYGDDYGIYIESEVDNGTTVEITLPL